MVCSHSLRGSLSSPRPTSSKPRGRKWVDPLFAPRAPRGGPITTATGKPNHRRLWAPCTPKRWQRRMGHTSPRTEFTTTSYSLAHARLRPLTKAPARCGGRPPLMLKHHPCRKCPLRPGRFRHRPRSSRTHLRRCPSSRRTSRDHLWKSKMRPLRTGIQSPNARSQRASGAGRRRALL